MAIIGWHTVDLMYSVHKWLSSGEWEENKNVYLNKGSLDTLRKRNNIIYINIWGSIEKYIFEWAFCSQLLLSLQFEIKLLPISK